MNNNQRFIAFDLKEKNDTDTLISSLLSKSIELMNEKANSTPSLFSKMKGSDVETFSYNSMCEIAPSVSLDPEAIKLVSGHTFPDIIIEKTPIYYFECLPNYLAVNLLKKEIFKED